MKKVFILVFVLMVFCTVFPFAETNGWKLVWSDEFDGQAIDLKNWNLIEGGFGGGNEELQYYSSRQKNVFVSNGVLVLQAFRESFGGRNYTSAKLTSQDKAEWLHGKFEFRAKLPLGKGMWPAIWMMPSGFVPFWDKSRVSTNRYGEWPSCGEIDIMEYGGSKPRTVQGTLIFGKPFTFIKRRYTLSDNRSFADDFHLFAFEWEPGVMRWYVDGALYAVRDLWFGRARETTTNFIYPAPFNVKFFLQLNLAVGGNFDGDPDGTTPFPGQFQLDYVRVYRKDKYPPIAYSVTNDIPQIKDRSLKFNPDKKLTLVLNAEGFTNDLGNACFLVSKNGLLNAVRTVRSAISNKTSSAVIRDLPEGYYLIFVYHDENGNGMLDLVPEKPWPSEGSSVAGQLSIIHEPPTYDKHAVLVKGGRTNFHMDMLYDYQ